MLCCSDLTLQKRQKKLKVFRIIAGFCVFTQILSPVLQMFETSEQNFPYPIQWIHENNWNFYIRSDLSTISIVLLSFYNIKYTCQLFSEMGNHTAFKSKVRCKIICISILIQVVFIARLTYIWTSNFFFY
jgi:hypothetical protein